MHRATIKIVPYPTFQTQIVSIRILPMKTLFIRFYYRWHVVAQIQGTEAKKRCCTMRGAPAHRADPNLLIVFVTCLTTALLIGIYSTQGLGVQWVMRRVRPSAPLTSWAPTIKFIFSLPTHSLCDNILHSQTVCYVKEGNQTLKNSVNLQSFRVSSSNDMSCGARFPARQFYYFLFSHAVWPWAPWAGCLGPQHRVQQRQLGRTAVLQDLWTF